MASSYFGTDGIRGRVGELPMTPDFVMKLGWAVGKVLGGKGRREVVVGKDTRASGYMFESALESGLSAAGHNIALVGPLPTPAIAYLTETFRADAGIVISASHNPYYDNGIKLFSASGAKISDASQQSIEEYFRYALKYGIDCVAPENLGKARRIADAAGRYIEYCKRNFPLALTLKGIRLVLDTANGAGYKVAPAVYSELGAQVINIHNCPDGVNINANCGATDLASLCSAVKEHSADLGIALDGDADRVMLVDHTGEVVDGDEILFLLAKAAREGGYAGGVVGTLMSNQGLEMALQQLDIPFSRAKVGDRYVMEQLESTGWRIGGEGSGHILHLDHASTGDAIVASLQVLALLVREGCSLHKLKQGMFKLPQVLLNVKFNKADQADPLQCNNLQRAVQEIEDTLGQSGRVLLRTSGTEPLIRVMVEAKDAVLARKSAEYLASFVE